MAHAVPGDTVESMPILPALRRPAVLVALLLATVLVGTVAPVTDARLPKAHHSRPGRITLDTNLLSPSGLSAWAIDEYLAAKTPLPDLGRAFMDAERTYGVNARFLLAAALHESGWGRSAIATRKHNLFGFNAYDRDPGRYASAYDTFAANVDAVARFIKESYLVPSGRWWGGQPTLRSMQRYWSSSGRWGAGVARIATSLHLPTLRSRGVRFADPVIRALVHGGDTVTVRLAWRGGAIPDGLRVAATWVPDTLDSDIIAATSAHADGDTGAADGHRSATGGDASGAAGSAPAAAHDPVTAVVRPSSLRHTAMTLRVQAPAQPGTWHLRLALLDKGGRPLPAPDRVGIPAVAVRVWADRAVDYALTPTRDGTGVVLRVTNTGREAIPALPSWDGAAPADPEVQAARSAVLLTATTGDPGTPAPIALVASPLSEDLEPGASLEFAVPGIRTLTGRSVNWLVAELRVLDDPTWLQAYGPVTARRTASRLGVVHRLGVGSGPVAGEGTQWAAEPARAAGTAGAAGSTAAAGSPAASSAPHASTAPAASLVPQPQPQPAPTARPAESPSATPKPAATPAPATASPVTAQALVVAPLPTPAPSATPKATSTATSPARIVTTPRHVTRTIGERARAIRYRGGWSNARGSGYAGGSVTWSRTAGATARLTFTGTSVTWIGPKGPTRGSAVVLVDGKVVARVSTFSRSFTPRAVLFHRSFRDGGTHTVTIKVLGTRGHPYVAIDGFVIRT